MAEQYSGHNKFNEEELPVPIPPVDQAWQSMRQKLDMALPAEGNLPVPARPRYLWIKTTAVIVAVATVTTALWLYNHKHRTAPIASTPAAVIHADSVPAAITTLQISSSSTDNSSATQSDTGNGDFSASSSSSQPLQEVKSSVLLPSSVADKQYTAPEQKVSTDQLTKASSLLASTTPGKRYTNGKNSSTVVAERPDKNRPSFRSSIADNAHTAGKTALHPSNIQPATAPRPLSGKVISPAGDHDTGETAGASSLQLDMIQAASGKYNTSLQRKPDLFLLRQHSKAAAEKNWVLYIQLNIPLPLYGNNFYFMGPDGKDQFYRNLIPAIRVERKLRKGALSLDIQAASSASLKPESYEIRSDTLPSSVDTARSFLKQSGWGLALQYQLPVRGRWQAGAGVQLSFLSKAVMQQTLTDMTDSARHTTSTIYAATAADKQDLSKVRISGMAELNYIAGKWQLGLRALVPLTPVSKTRNISARPLNVEFVLRRRLWSK